VVRGVARGVGTGGLRHLESERDDGRTRLTRKEFHYAWAQCPEGKPDKDTDDGGECHGRGHHPAGTPDVVLSHGVGEEVCLQRQSQEGYLFVSSRIAQRNRDGYDMHGVGKGIGGRVKERRRVGVNEHRPSPPQ